MGNLPRRSSTILQTPCCSKGEDTDSNADIDAISKLLREFKAPAIVQAPYMHASGPAWNSYAVHTKECVPVDLIAKLDVVKI